jgi:hypothetical protein
MHFRVREKFFELDISNRFQELSLMALCVVWLETLALKGKRTSSATRSISNFPCCCCVNAFTRTLGYSHECNFVSYRL